MNDDQIKMFLDDNIPIVIGKCPSCHAGDRSLILIDYVHNPHYEGKSTVYMKCMACFGVFQRTIREMASG